MFEDLRPPYATIVADPPWPITDPRSRPRIGAGGRRRRSTTLSYSLMSIDDVQALLVESLAADDALLFLWSTRLLFREGVTAAIARAWGFEPCGELIWGLRNPGMGGAGHEPILIARRGRASLPREPMGRSVWFWRQVYATQHGKPGKVHSAKPPAFGDLVEQLASAPYLELFARQPRLGWDSWGHGYRSLAHEEAP